MTSSTRRRPTTGMTARMDVGELIDCVAGADAVATLRCESCGQIRVAYVHDGTSITHGPIGTDWPIKLFITRFKYHHRMGDDELFSQMLEVMAAEGTCAEAMAACTDEEVNPEFPLS